MAGFGGPSLKTRTRARTTRRQENTTRSAHALLPIGVLSADSDDTRYRCRRRRRGIRDKAKIKPRQLGVVFRDLMEMEKSTMEVTCAEVRERRMVDGDEGLRSRLGNGKARRHVGSWQDVSPVLADRRR